MRFVSIGAFALLAASAAQAQEERPQGWMTRFDREGVTEANLERFVSMAPGWHISTGRGAGIFYDPSMTARSEYTLTSTVLLFDPGRRHREAYGVFFGGRDLQGDGQAYSYFVIRDTGEYLIKRRKGSSTETVVDWTTTDAIMKYPGDGEQAKNVLEVVCGAESVDFYVNGTKLTSLPRNQLDVDGIVGLRLNHGLEVHVSELHVDASGTR